MTVERDITIIGVAGGTGSGKSTLAWRVAEALGRDSVSILSFDCYYNDLSHLAPEQRAAANFDHPDALDRPRFVQDLARLARGESAQVPVYDFATHSRCDETVELPPRPVIIAEGILLLAFDEILQWLHHTVFLDVPEGLRLRRRIDRDTAERGRTEASVRRQFLMTVQPMHAQFVQPSAEHAQIVLHSDYDLDGFLADLRQLTVRAVSVPNVLRAPVRGAAAGEDAQPHG